MDTALNNPKKRGKIRVMDTTLRDGEQTQNVSFSPEEKLAIAKTLLEKVKADAIEVSSARTSPGEAKAVKKITAWASQKRLLDKVEVLGFVDGKKSVDWIGECGAVRMNLLAKGSLVHLEKQLGKSPGEHFEEIRKTVKYAAGQGIKTSVFLEDWSNGAKESRQYTERLIGELAKMQVERIYLTDTLGILTPRETQKLVSETVKSFPEKTFEFHAHNDYGLATANSLAAINAGCLGLHTTVNGLGERAGNAPLDEVAAVINDKTGFECSVNEKELAEASRLVEAFSGKRVAANKPIMGSNAFTQTAGIHADGDKKASLYESPLKPERFGKERKYALGKLSGKASLEQNLEKLGIKLEKQDMKRVLERIIDLGDNKKTVTVEDLPYIISDTLDTPEERKIRIVDCTVNSGMRTKPSASLTLETGKQEYSEKAVGDGGYDAFMNALAKASKKAGLELPMLVDYEVKIPPGGKTNALVETTITWKTRKGKEFATTGVDPDQVMAAVKATEKMINHAPTNGETKNRLKIQTTFDQTSKFKQPLTKPQNSNNL